MKMGNEKERWISSQANVSMQTCSHNTLALKLFRDWHGPSPLWQFCNGIELIEDMDVSKLYENN